MSPSASFFPSVVAGAADGIAAAEVAGAGGVSSFLVQARSVRTRSGKALRNMAVVLALPASLGKLPEQALGLAFARGRQRCDRAPIDLPRGNAPALVLDRLGRIDGLVRDDEA